MSGGRRFGGKTVLITGAARGMGAAGARAIAAEGGTVLLADVLDERGQALAADIGEAAHYVRLDVRDEADWGRAVEAARARGGLHGLVNNAAVYVPQSLTHADAGEFRRHMEVNQLGCFLGMQRAAPLLEASGGGSIVNMSSSAGLKGSARAIAYSATKWAVRGMTKAAAIELAKAKIRVNSVHPGPINTEMLDALTAEQREARRRIVPLQREGEAEEVAALWLFLLSDESRFITGAEIAIDGGVSLL